MHSTLQIQKTTIKHSAQKRREHGAPILIHFGNSNYQFPKVRKSKVTAMMNLADRVQSEH